MAECSRKGNLGLPNSLLHGEGAPGVLFGKGSGRGQLLVPTPIRAVPGKTPAYCRVQGQEGATGAVPGLGGGSGSRGGGEDAVEVCQEQLHGLVLLGHAHGQAAGLPLRAQQRWPEHDADVLARHEVDVCLLHHPGNARNSGKFTQPTRPPPFCLCCPWGFVPQGSIALMACPNPSSHPMGTTPSLPSSAPVILPSYPIP